jgi:hypothetical protein
MTGLQRVSKATRTVEQLRQLATSMGTQKLTNQLVKSGVDILHAGQLLTALTPKVRRGVRPGDGKQPSAAKIANPTDNATSSSPTDVKTGKPAPSNGDSDSTKRAPKNTDQSFAASDDKLDEVEAVSSKRKRDTNTEPPPAAKRAKVVTDEATRERIKNAIENARGSNKVYHLDWAKTKGTILKCKACAGDILRKSAMFVHLKARKRRLSTSGVPYAADSLDHYHLSCIPRNVSKFRVFFEPMVFTLCPDANAVVEAEKLYKSL